MVLTLSLIHISDIDDKLIKKGQEEGTSMKEVAQRFEAEYLKDCLLYTSAAARITSQPASSASPVSGCSG